MLIQYVYVHMYVKYLFFIQFWIREGGDIHDYVGGFIRGQLMVFISITYSALYLFFPS